MTEEVKEKIHNKTEEADVSVDMERLAKELRPDSVTAASQLKAIAPSYDAIAAKVTSIPVTSRPVSQLQNVHQETFTLTEEWHCEEWDKVISFAVMKMAYGDYVKMANDMMDEISAEFKRIEERYPDSSADQISRQALPNALQAWAKKLSK